MKEIMLKSDEYQDREKFGSTIIFMVECNPYKGIEKAFKVPKQIHEEYKAWEESGRVFRYILELARCSETIRYILKSK